MYLKYFIGVIKIYIPRLKEIRKDRDINQKQVAKYLKITQQQYSLYESGERELPIRLLIELSKYYQLSTDYILGLSNNEREKSINYQINGRKKQINGNNYGKITIK